MPYSPLAYWDPTRTSGFKIFGCEVSDIGIKVDKVESILEAVKTALSPNTSRITSLGLALGAVLEGLGTSEPFMRLSWGIESAP